MRWIRYFTIEGQGPFEGVALRQITGEAGETYIIPLGWTDAALKVLVSDIFHPGPLPVKTVPVEEAGVPIWLQRRISSGERTEKGEHDVRDVIRRVAGGSTYAAWKSGFFGSGNDARIFYDELCRALLHRIISFETGYWRAMGLDWAYGLEASSFSKRHRIVDFDVHAPQAFRRARILAETLALSNDSPALISLPVENPDSAEFIAWKRDAEMQRVAEDLGLKTLSYFLYQVMDACDRDSFSGFNPRRNRRLQEAMEEARAAGVLDGAIAAALRYAQYGYENIPLPSAREENTADFVRTAISLSDDFIEAALTGHGFALKEGQGVILRHAPAQKMWNTLAEAVWATGEPVLHFQSRMRDGFCADESGGFVYMPGTCAPAGAINLLTVTAQGLPQAARLLVVALDVAAEGQDRPLMLGFVNAASLLMREGIAYDSNEGRAMIARLVSAIEVASFEASAEMAVAAGAYDGWACVEKSRLIALKGKPGMEAALTLARQYGFRHAHLCGLSDEKGLHTLLGAMAQAIAPEITLVGLEGGSSDSYARSLHPAIPSGLARLGYKPREIEDIHFFVAGHGTLLDAPYINHASLRLRGLDDEMTATLERALRSARHLRHVFDESVLASFSEDEIEEASLYACGAGTLEGAPHLMSQHLDIFDCVHPPALSAVRRVSPEARLRMQAAVEKHLCGGVGQVISLDVETSVDDVQKLILLAWESGAKTLRLYRDGCSWLQPVLPAALEASLRKNIQPEEKEICLKQSASA